MWHRLRSNLLLIGAVALLVWAAAWPTMREGRYQAEVFELASLVTDLTNAAQTRFRTAGSWPPAADPGVAPEGTIGTFGAAALATEHATVQWQPLLVSATLESAPDDLPPEAAARAVADSITRVRVTTPRQVGAIVVHSADERLLAELLARHSADDSFVRDTTWTLILTEPSAPGS